MLAAVDQEGTSESAIRTALHIAFSWELSCPAAEARCRRRVAGAKAEVVYGNCMAMLERHSVG